MTKKEHPPKKSRVVRKRLMLSRETLRDLSERDNSASEVKGGRVPLTKPPVCASEVNCLR